MSAAKHLVDPVERIARATERIADVIERAELRAKRGTPKATAKAQRHLKASETDVAIAIQHASRLGLLVGGKR